MLDTTLGINLKMTKTQLFSWEAYFIINILKNNRFYFLLVGIRIFFIEVVIFELDP